MFSFFSRIFRFRRKVAVPLEDGPKKSVSDYLDFINSTYGIKEIDNKINENINRYDLVFSEIKIIYEVELVNIVDRGRRMGCDVYDHIPILLFKYNGSTSICNGSTPGVSRNYLNRPQRFQFSEYSNIPDILTLHDIIDTSNTFSMYVNLNRMFGRIIANTDENIGKCLNSMINYGIFRVHISYKSSDPDDIIMDAFNFLSDYGLDIKYSCVNKVDKVISCRRKFMI